MTKSPETIKIEYGVCTASDVDAMAKLLAGLDDPTRDAAREGDSFMLQRCYPERSQAEVGKLFGQGFAVSLFDLASGAWHGPVLSGYGVRLAYVHDGSQSPPPDFTQVQARVLEDLQNERRQAFNEEQYAALLAKYNAVIQDEESTERKQLRMAKK